MIVRLAGLAGLLHGLAAAAMTLNEQTVLVTESLAGLTRPEGNLPRLADLLTLEGQASIFYSYARETEMSVLFTQSVGAGEGTTVFVPTNKAVQALARKPHEGPERSVVYGMNAEPSTTSKYNVQRWVGAHIIPSPDVNFTTPTPYDTMTPGVTIAFSAINNQDHPHPHEPIIDTDAAHLSSVQGKQNTPGNSDSLRLAGVNRCVHPGGSNRRTGSPINTSPVMDTDAAHFASIKGPVSSGYDTTQITNSKESSVHKPIWKYYELNVGIHIISEKKASNGVLYLIDGAVPVGAE